MNGSFTRMTPIFTVYRFLAFSLLPFTLSGCFGSNEPKTIAKIAEEARRSIVLITYADIKGFGTGFFVLGNDGFCTVLTMDHVVRPSQKIQLTSELDKKLYEASTVQRLDKLDLAVVTFDVPNKGKCPYPALELGDSDKVRIGDRVVLSGYPTREGESTVLLQSPKGDVTDIENPPLPEGYAISYDATSVSGMSGSPILDATGKVIAIHGHTDSEIVKLAQEQQGSLSPEQTAKVAKISNREQVTRINHFKWGIPIKYYLLEQVKLAQGAKDLSAKKKYEEGGEFYNEGSYEEAIDAFDEAIQLKNNYAEAYNYRGVARSSLDNQKGAFADYDKAIQLKNDFAEAYFNRGVTRDHLGDKKGALTDYDKAIQFKNDYAEAYNNRGIVRADLGYEIGSIVDYDKAARLYFNRGFTHAHLGDKKGALTDYDKAIQLKNDLAFAYYGRGLILRSLGQKQSALKSFQQAANLLERQNDSTWLQNAKNQIKELASTP